MCVMCTSGRRPDGAVIVTRRQLLSAAASFALAAQFDPKHAVAASTTPTVQDVGAGLRIAPRSAWGAGLEPRGALQREERADVRFLLIHHTETANGYLQARVPQMLRAFYRYHTDQRGWPDIAYNFLVDAYGDVWEGRTGSLDGPVMGSASGGSQGFAMLACYIGDHRPQAPTAAAQAAMATLLGWLAREYSIDLSPGATTSFVSRGSSRYERGANVVTPTIAGHRDMSSHTDCPGDAAYALLPELRRAAGAALGTPGVFDNRRQPDHADEQAPGASPSPMGSPSQEGAAAGPIPGAAGDRSEELATAAALAAALVATGAAATVSVRSRR